MLGKQNILSVLMAEQIFLTQILAQSILMAQQNIIIIM